MAFTPEVDAPIRLVTLIPQSIAAQASDPEPASSVGNQSSETLMNSSVIWYSRFSVVGPLPN